MEKEGGISYQLNVVCVCVCVSTYELDHPFSQLWVWTLCHWDIRTV